MMRAETKNRIKDSFINCFLGDDPDSKKITFVLKNISVKKKKPVQWFFKRMIDLTLSILGLIFLSPFLLLVCLAIVIDSKGPAIYKQKRVGAYNKQFHMYKFRSMKLNADQEKEKLVEKNQTNPVMFKMYDDPRITRVGKFIRRFSIDELPQLFNVFIGNMSLVGPRPPLPDEVKKYKSWHYFRFATKPGITGRWQTSGRSRIKNFDRVVRLDYKYISRWNLGADFKILLKTIPAVISTKGAA